MPRQSRASLEAIPFNPVDGRPHRLKPPHDLAENERRLWVELVGGCPPEHFRETDGPLLKQYIAMILLAEQAARGMQAKGGPISADGQKWFSVHQRAVRAMSVLSLRLRLAPSTRTDAKAAGRAAASHIPSFYDRMEAERTQ
jgi:hypothetical protein